MAINRVVLGIEEILDFSDATVDAPTALKGVVGYNSKGEKFVGEYEGLNISDSTISPSTVLKGYKGYNAAGKPFVGEYEGVDLTKCTISPETVLKGYVGINAKGEIFVGTYEGTPTPDIPDTPDTPDTPDGYTSSEFLESGTFTVPNGVSKIEVHLVGGGAGGSTVKNGTYTGTDLNAIMVEGYMGGGSGYTKTVTLDVVSGELLDVSVGNGGAAGADGEASIIKRGSTVLAQADGGKTDGSGGSGGGAANVYYNRDFGFVFAHGNAGGTDGSDGATLIIESQNGVINSASGKGQGYTTRDFGEATGTLRCQGGAGSNYETTDKTAAVANSGNGGNAPILETPSLSNPPTAKIETQATAGSSGIVLIRWAAA